MTLGDPVIWRLHRISIAMTFFVIVPWMIVLATIVRFEFIPEVPPTFVGAVDEMKRLTIALDSYAARYGEYPPDFTSRDPRKEIDEHLTRIFPQRDAQLDTPSFVNELGPDNALEFWLRGLCEDNPKCPLTGKVGADKAPLTNEQIKTKIYASDYIQLLISDGATPGPGLEQSKAYQDLLASYNILQEQQRKDFASLTERVPLFSFRIKRLSQRGAYHLRGCLLPLVYFRSDNYENAEFQGDPEWGVARPYRRELADGRSDFMAPEQYQIICAGHDENFGTASIAATDAARYSGHLDNLTSFSPEPLGVDVLIEKRRQAKRIRNRSPFVALFCTCMLYPIVMSLRCHQDGIMLLEQETRRQCLAMQHSQSWRRRLARQKQTRRRQALVRMGENEHSERTSASRTDV